MRRDETKEKDLGVSLRTETDESVERSKRVLQSTHAMALVDSGSNWGSRSLLASVLLPHRRVEDVKVDPRSSSAVESGISLVRVDPLTDLSSSSHAKKKGNGGERRVSLSERATSEV